eukprot:COSAG03_NODE_395_length_8260_cov_22.465997_4_plen_70_part_00
MAQELSTAGAQAPRVGKYVVDIPAFESVAIPCLMSASEGKQPQLLLVDEVGKCLFGQTYSIIVALMRTQ